MLLRVTNYKEQRRIMLQQRRVFVPTHVSESIRAIPLHNRLEMLNNAVL
jgi:hypothetical protein